jgi:hypothetical protein
MIQRRSPRLAPGGGAAPIDDLSQPGVISRDVHRNLKTATVLLPYLNACRQPVIQEATCRGPIDSSCPAGALDPDPTASPAPSAIERPA